ncbi:PREDICTED: stress-response A/B barrel domain-containing protein UP3-like [Camelina sativa]|uniref:Stress-response A/B barrel domain-containing protein UP3-like n=1 Tax=Camelina sativa TaxID=90675 RepID=A0ABM0WDW8_CAMSA|nr:PREDICTED: stress-response A/B barrel domain-containing protein UP3-like [Camelina sativa]
MICARIRPLISSPLAFTISTTKHSSSPTNLRLLPRRRSFSAVTAMSSSSTTQSQIIEHIVLFKAKDDADSNKITSMISNLNALASLDEVLYISAAPLHRLGSSSAFAFTHVLHSRYGSKEDLSTYAAHPDHVRVVKESVLPICDDLMAVDWIADRIPGTLAPAPGSVGKLTLLKLKEDVSDEAKSEITGVVKGLGEKFPGIDQITVGENFSPARAKGFSIASIAYFKDLSEMEAVDAQKELVNLEKDKVRDYVDSTIVVEFLVSSQTCSSL